MNDKRLIEVTKLLRKHPIEEIQHSINNDTARRKLLNDLRINEDEFAAYLETNVSFKIDEVIVNKPRRQVIQAMHSCC